MSVKSLTGRGPFFTRHKGGADRVINQCLNYYQVSIGDRIKWVIHVKRKWRTERETERGTAYWEIVTVLLAWPLFGANRFKSDTKGKAVTGNSWCGMGEERGHACRAPWWNSWMVTTGTCVHILREIRIESTLSSTHTYDCSSLVSLFASLSLLGCRQGVTVKEDQDQSAHYEERGLR